MTFAIKVEGGTGAGRKRPPRDKPKPWECACVDGLTTKHYRQQPAYMSRCHVCKQERP